MSTKENPGAFDGMERAAPDEPVFTLRAHDPLAAALVHEWVDRRRKAIRDGLADGQITSAKAHLEMIQCREAEEVAWSMEQWRQAAPVEVEEADKPAAAPYSGHVSSEAEIAAKARYDAIKKAVGELHNAIAAATSAANETLRGFGFFNERAVILAMIKRIGLVAEHITPKRRSYYAGEPAPEPFNLKNAFVCINDLSGLGETLQTETGNADPS